MYETDQAVITLSRFLSRRRRQCWPNVKTAPNLRNRCLSFVTVALMGTLLSTNASADTVIYAIGDSITRGTTHTFDSDEYPLSAYRNRGVLPANNIRSYREHAHDALIAPGCEADITWAGAKAENNRTPSRHEGRSGFRADQILENTWQDDEDRFSPRNIDGWLSTFQPDVVLIHLGTNDMTEGEDAVSTSDEIDELISRIYRQQPSATVVLANVIPIHGWWATHVRLPPFSIRDVAAEVSALAGLIANIVSTRQANGDDIHLVDVNSDFFVDEENLTVCGGSAGNPNNMSTTSCQQAPDGSGLVPDGVHPNLLGEAFIGRQFADVLINQVGICEESDDASPTVPDSSPPPDSSPSIVLDDPLASDADTLALSIEILSPASAGVAVNSSFTASGIATDASGSGVDRVDVAYENSEGLFYDFDGGFGIAMTLGRATLTDRTSTDTQWSHSVILPEDTYTLHVNAHDLAGNVNAPFITQSFGVSEANISSPAVEPDTVGAALGSAVTVGGGTFTFFEFYGGLIALMVVVVRRRRRRSFQVGCVQRSNERRI